MRRLSLLAVLGLATLAACSKPAEKPAEPAAAAPAPKGPRAFVTVLYNTPKSAADFEKYYWESHIPMVGTKQAEVGFTAAELTKFDHTLDGKAPTFYRQAVLWFDDMAALEQGIATPGFKAIGDDLANFATGGLVALVGEETGDASPLLTGDTTAFVTVIYNQPADAAAFESYYSEKHLPLVGDKAAEIGFNRAELVKFTRNLDGTAPAYYRQAKLYFPNGAGMMAGLKSDGFKAVGGDLPNFATGGLVGLVGHLTSKP